MGAIYDGLNKNLTFEDNIQSFQKTLEFTTDAAYSVGTWNVISIAIPDTFKNRVSGVLTMQFGPKDPLLTADIAGLYISWVENNRQVEINWIGGLADSETYVARWLVI